MLSKSAEIYTTDELHGLNASSDVKIMFVETSPVFSKHTHAHTHTSHQVTEQWSVTGAAKCLRRWGRQQQCASFYRWAKWFLNRWFLTSAQTCLRGKLSFYVVFAHRVFILVKKKQKTNKICNFSLETWKLKKRKKKFSFTSLHIGGKSGPGRSNSNDDVWKFRVLKQFQRSLVWTWKQWWGLVFSRRESESRMSSGIRHVVHASLVNHSLFTVYTFYSTCCKCWKAAVVGVVSSSARWTFPPKSLFLGVYMESI